jgi:hypothetical protein
MHLVPASGALAPVPFKIASRGSEQMVGTEHEANAKAITFWLQWGEPGGSFHHCKSVTLNLN